MLTVETNRIRREHFLKGKTFTPRLRFKNYEELNAWLLDQCVAYAKAHRHPELSDQTIWEVYEAERSKLVPYAGRFDGFHAVPAWSPRPAWCVSTTTSTRVIASAVGRPVDVHAYADHVVIRQDGRIVGEHRRSFGRGETIYDPWHYVPVLARKPGALRNGAPFKDWILPQIMFAFTNYGISLGLQAVRHTPDRVARLNQYFDGYQSGDHYDSDAIAHVMACTSHFPGTFLRAT